MLERWLKSLPNPIGLIACNDVRGRHVLEACLNMGIRVPDTMAVIGVDNDDLFCDCCQPPLSSVEIDSEQAGFQAARLLDRMMKGKIHSARRIIAKPTHVVERHSTNILAMTDIEVAAALRFIRQTRGRNINVRDVLDQIPLSRRSLEMRFKKAAGRSIHQEIQTCRLQWVGELLRTTDLPLAKVAELAGYSSLSYMDVLFQRQTGLTPLKYKRYHQRHLYP